MLDGVRKVHLIGIGGIGVSGVARLLHANGLAVQGSDVRESSITAALRQEGIPVAIGHRPDNLGDADLVVVSTAIPETNPELQAAREQERRVVHRSEVLGELLSRGESIAVIGTHGKGTVTSMIAWILTVAGRDPGFYIGALCHNLGVNARPGAGPYVAEVDESDGSLVNVKPEAVVLNNLELDHLNYYPSWEKLAATVHSFFERNPRLRQAFVNVDDPGVRRLLRELPALPLVTFAIDHPEADYRAVSVETRGMRSTFDVMHRGVRLGTVALHVPGLYNVHNALGAVAACHAAGVEFEAIRTAMAEFRGLENRFTLVEAAGVQVVKDYISHPTGIRRVLEAAAQVAQGSVTVVFKPYRFTMIHYLGDEYRECFRGADHTIVTTMYTAGEVPIPGVDTPWLCDKIRESGSRVTFIPEMEDIVPHLMANVRPGEMVAFFGGDDLFRLADAYVETLRTQEQS